jgi:AmmeMemoRadiSam system protein B
VKSGSGPGALVGVVLALTVAALAGTPSAAAPPAPVTAPAPSAVPPSLDEVRRGMGIPSRDDLRGQTDTVGYASHPTQMARVWDLSSSLPAPDSLGPTPAPGVAGVICPHDDFLYAGRVYRRVLPLITARTVVLVGVFHRYRRFGAHDALVFDPYPAWRAPDGEVRVSPLRDDLIARLPKEDVVRSAAMHDSEHSLEALVFWLRHLRSDLEIVPIIVPAASFARLDTLAAHLGEALDGAMHARGLALGRDVAIAISTDGIHYGPDFRQTRFGDGGAVAYEKAVALDRSLLASMRGPLRTAMAERLFATFVDPAHPDDYRWTWCGRFSVPFGLLLLERLGRSQGGAVGHPLAYATSVGAPELPVRELGLGETAPANLFHFVGYPAAAFTITPQRR